MEGLNLMYQRDTSKTNLVSITSCGKTFMIDTIKPSKETLLIVLI